MRDKFGVESPCLGCASRVLGCHSSCEKYRSYQKKHSSAVEAYRKARLGDTLANARRKEAIEDWKRYKHRA
jgi:Ni/Co efflux regulator RcnB